MITRSIRIINYKCFGDSGEITFGDRVNLVIGQNNSGKSSLLECLDRQRFSNKPHRDLRIKENDPLNPMSSIETTFIFSGSELYTILMGSAAQISIRMKVDNSSLAKTQITNLFESQKIEFTLRYPNGPWIKSTQKYCNELAFDNQGAMFSFVPAADKQSWDIVGPTNAVQDGLPITLGDYFWRSTYVFRAERFGLGRSSISDRPPLQTNARNLATCLLELQGRNTSRFNRFVSLIREIFPSVRGIPVAQALNNSNENEILVWNVDPSTERAELTVSLEDSGTGIGQVLSILYVAIVEDTGKLLVIDEPNSFLHPSASRKLVSILEQFDQHQYIISTHSPEIIARSRLDTVHILKRGDYQTTVQMMDSKDISSLKEVLGDLGVHLSDVFSPDAITWVEGQTEEKCFPLLLKAAGIELPRGVSVVAVLHTGDFDIQEDRAVLVFRLYERLSHVNALVPPALAFVFDQEGRSEQELADLKRRGSGRVKVLPRMMYENYLLDPEAISQVLCSEANGAIVTEEKITEWLRDNGGKAKYYPYKWDKRIADEQWLTRVNSAKLLHDMFGDVTRATFAYRKTSHSVALTEWLIEHRPERLTELMEFVRGISLN